MSRRSDKYGLAALLLAGVWVLYYWLRPSTPAVLQDVSLSLDDGAPPALVDLGPAGGAPAERPAAPAVAPGNVVGAEPVRTPTPVPTEYVAQAGDTLTGVSQKVYGRASDWTLIYNANRTLLNRPEDLRPGMRLIIPPPVSPPTSDAGARP